ncbi:MAG TPA: hypothetical protein VGJ86_01705 [Acidimicrobiales bacterium]
MQAYRASNDYMEQALRSPDPTAPELQDHFSGAALTESADLLLQAQQNLEYYESSLASDPEVVSGGSVEVVLRDCVTETLTIFDAASGAQKDARSTVGNWRVRVVDIDGVGWRVDEITLQEESCTP